MRTQDRLFQAAIPASLCETKQTLFKGRRKKPERKADNIRAADPLFVCQPGWRCTWCDVWFPAFGSSCDFDLTLEMLTCLWPQAQPTNSHRLTVFWLYQARRDEAQLRRSKKEHLHCCARSHQCPMLYHYSRLR